MAITNHERVGKALDLLRQGLGPFIEREVKTMSDAEAEQLVSRLAGDERLAARGSLSEWDAAALLKLMWEAWNDVFRKTLGHAERSIVSELREVRNKWAHQEAFSGDDAYRALDSTERLLTAVSAPEAADVEKMKMELLRVRFDQQTRSERRRSATVTVESQVTGSLKPWREVVTPHADVASGRYQQAEFAADLWQVHIGEGTDEYRDPVEFFQRTYLTESLSHLLTGAIRRLSGKGGDPVVQLQTNFGGGKTHSMLALYHLFSGTRPSELADIEPVLTETGVSELPKVNRVVLVGNRISPGNPVVKPDGTVVRTLWGEIAWQLGYAAGGAKRAKKAFQRVEADDEKATSPGDALRELMNDFGPCLILIDEWVAYARQLHDEADLPAGSFETQFTFAQALTESARAAKSCLVVISLPASDVATSPHTQADDVEVGGQRGREALDRMRNVVGRVESSWRPASTEEGFEIVRRRLFEPMTDPVQFRDRDVVARAFYDLYRSQKDEFPPECREADYEKRIKGAYPIHPEVFDRLYSDWSTLVKFQRTRGVLRLMASVIHSLWEKGDRNALILPSMIPIDDPRVQPELTNRYLSDNWVPVIEKDVDGPNSLPVRLDAEKSSTFGRVQAARRVARTIYLGSAPTLTAAHKGIEDRRIKLGCLMPGESPAVFGDALRHLASSATYLYHDTARYWYSTQPTVTKLAEDRAEQLRRDYDKVIQEIERRVRGDLKSTGDFRRVHPLPQSSQDVLDDLDARLVVLSPEHPYSKEEGNRAHVLAKAMLETRGSTPRLFQNALVFLAADQARLADLERAVSLYLAWASILTEKEELDLSLQQVKLAERQLSSADGTVAGQLPETYQWLLAPVQENPNTPVTSQAYRLSGQEPLAVRVSRKLKNDEALLTALAGSRLRMELDRVPLWRGDHVPIPQLMEDFARYIYLPRLASPAVLRGAIEDGLGLINWEQDGFAYADSFDEEAGRYRGLKTAQQRRVPEDDRGLLVRPEAARRQMEQEKPPDRPEVTGRPPEGQKPAEPGPTGAPTVDEKPPKQRAPKRFHGSVDLSPERVGRDAGRIAEEVIAHLAGLPGSKVTVSLEIDVEVPDGTPENVVRIVTENSRTLKFTTQGFEEE